MLHCVASMSVKDVLQGLVDDALVDTDRVGTSNYFWAFPSKVANNVSKYSSLMHAVAGALATRASVPVVCVCAHNGEDVRRRKVWVCS